MIGKVDLVMWTKNGEKTLPKVLNQIENAIPDENVHRKILVDDHSTDTTTKIAEVFSWEVYENPSTGITSGANEALRHVDCSFFVSIEQDVILAEGWWQKIPKYMDDGKVAVAQGVRISTEPTLRVLDEYVYSRMESNSPIKFGVSMDNNIFKTKIIKQLGGFPYGCPVCTDTILMKKIMFETPYKWIVDRTVISKHIRQSIEYHIKHCYKLSRLCTHTSYCVPRNPSRVYVRLLLTSPLTGLKVAYKKKCPQMIWIYPQIRFIKFTGFLAHREKGK